MSLAKNVSGHNKNGYTAEYSDTPHLTDNKDDSAVDEQRPHEEKRKKNNDVHVKSQ